MWKTFTCQKAAFSRKMLAISGGMDKFSTTRVLKMWKTLFRVENYLPLPEK
jgi:hypothetical protein